MTENDSGLTFEEWDQSEDTDDSQAPVAMIVNSNQLRVSDFELREVIPLQLEEKCVESNVRAARL